MYQIVFYVPADNLESVKTALFASGAGRIGSYDQCAWQTKGTGQFRPLSGSDPHIGEMNMKEKVEEFKVEMVCEDNFLDEVIFALKKAHPYEVPAYCVFKLENF